MVHDQLENIIPSPLAGEGQGEGDNNKPERSDYLNSKLKTYN